MNGERPKRLIVIAVYGSLNGELLVGLDILQKTADRKRGAPDLQRVRSVRIDHAVAFNDGVIRKVSICAIIKDIHGLDVLFIIVNGADQRAGGIRVARPPRFASWGGLTASFAS